MARKLQKTRPNLESLEHRTLLSGGNNRGLLLPNGQPINEADHTRLVNRLNAAGLDPQNLSLPRGHLRRPAHRPRPPQVPHLPRRHPRLAHPLWRRHP